MKLLLDTSVWIDHLANADARIADALRHGDIVIHPWIVGEIALGNLGPRRAEILDLLGQINPVIKASDREVLQMIEVHRLGGAGIGWVDAHLVASAILTPHVRLISRDKRLMALRERPAFHDVIGGWEDA